MGLGDMEKPLHTPVAGFDAHSFRAALGRFPTGVTVVTSLAADGAPLGVTVNSFNSVSLEPPLILWSLQRSSAYLADFEATGRFAVNVLEARQQALSERFASQLAERFEDVDWRPGEESCPLLKGCIAHFECRTEAIHDGGDHVIFVGRVIRFDQGAGDPLIFCDGEYR